MGRHSKRLAELPEHAEAERDRDINTAIDALDRGFKLKHDHYNGINLALMLDVRASHSAGNEATADRVDAQRVRRRVADICRAQLEAGIVADTPEKAEEERFWVRASLAEAEFGLGDADAQHRFKRRQRSKRQRTGCSQLPASNWRSWQSCSYFSHALDDLAGPTATGAGFGERRRDHVVAHPLETISLPAEPFFFQTGSDERALHIFDLPPEKWAPCSSLRYTRTGRAAPSRDRGSRADARVRFSGCRRSSPSAHCPSNLPYGSLIGCFSNGESAIPISASKILARCG